MYVAPEDLDEVLGAGTRTIGRRVAVPRAKLPPQLERLDELSTLFLVTVERGRAVIVASLDDPRAGEVVGDATIHDHDITDLIVRLGCDKVWRVPQWASTPRIVPPNDCQLLRYHLGLPIAGDMPYDASAPNAAVPVVHGAPAAKAPEPKHTDDEFTSAPTLRQPIAKPPAATPRPRSDTDPNTRISVSAMTAPARDLSPAPRRTGPMAVVHESVADALRALVFAMPASDAARREYAAHLQELGDLRGELIAIQLGRVERGEPISDRERELVASVGDACAEPLRQYFQSYELRRGFVWKACMKPGVQVSEEVRADPAWGTIEDLATTDAALLAAAPLSSLKAARIDQRTFEQLGSSDGLVSIDMLLPYPETHGPTRGISLEPIDIVRWLDVIDGGAFITHSLCVDAAKLGSRVPQFMQSRIARRLSHLDAWIDPTTAPAWREGFDKGDLPLLTLRFAAHSIEPVIAFERRDGAHRMVVELRATVSTEIAADLAKLIAGLGTGIRELELLDTSLAPFPAQQPELIAALGTSFETIKLRRGDSLALV